MAAYPEMLEAFALPAAAKVEAPMSASSRRARDLSRADVCSARLGGGTLVRDERQVAGVAPGAVRAESSPARAARRPGVRRVTARQGHRTTTRSSMRRGGKGPRTGPVSSLESEPNSSPSVVEGRVAAKRKAHASSDPRGFL